MRVSRRRPPADFGAQQVAAHDAVAAEADPQIVVAPDPIGFRPLETPEAGAAVTVQDARTPATTNTAVAEYPFEDEPPAGWPVWLVAFAVSALWALAPIAFAVGYRNDVAPLQNDQFALAVFALLAIGPAVFVWGCAYMIRQGQKLAFEGRRARAMAEDMLSPAMAAAARAGDVAQSVREEIARAGAMAEEAREALEALRQSLAVEAGALNDATAQSLRTAQELAGTLGRERTEMGQLAQTLDAQANRVADSITQQARMVSDAASLADTQIREAEATLSARAADLAAAAGEASDAARTAGEDLTRHIARLETAGVGVAEQVRAVEGGLSEQRTALVALSSVLKGDHEGFAVAAEAHSAKLGEFITQARLSAAEMSDRAVRGGESLRQLMAEAAAQFRDLAETAKAEREEFGQSTLHSLETVAAAAAEQRAHMDAQTRSAIEALANAAEETRAAAARHAAAAREQVDQLSEAAFTAGQKANQVFEARLEEARALVEQSSKMVEDAGSETARKLEAGAAAARQTLDELAAMLGELEARAGALPIAAQGHAERVKDAVAQGVEALMEQARRTAEEAQAIDTAFQERVRTNFEMLSQAVRLMGTVAAAPSTPLAVAAPPPPAPKRRPQPQPGPAAVEEAEPLELAEVAELAEPAPPEPEPEPAPPGAALAQEIGLRTRLRLTPTATDHEFSTVFAAAGGQPAPPKAEGEDEGDGEAWTWKDLLASLDGADGDGERIEVTLAEDLARMGVDPNRLLPTARVEEISAAVQTGDLEGARQVVKKLAPAATRRIARRLFTDDDLKRRAEIYVRRYKTLIEDAKVRDPEGFVLQNLLAGDTGRLFLLLDAAGGDMI